MALLGDETNFSLKQVILGMNENRESYADLKNPNLP
jgi:hypothetical protein